jgi:hypothetical protein
MSVHVARSPPSVPTLDGAAGRYELGGRVNIDDALSDLFDESRKSVEAMGVDAVAARLRKEARAQLRPRRLETQRQEDAGQDTVNFIEWDPNHQSASIETPATESRGP